MTYAAIIKENERRLSERSREYNPALGIGSLIPRRELLLYEDEETGEEVSVHLPLRMFEHKLLKSMTGYGSYENYLRQQHIGPLKFEKRFITLRCAFDFEFWCAKMVQIPLDAETRHKTGRDLGPLILNRAQRRYFAVLHEEFDAGRPVRVILLKARQWGGSTLTEAFFAWLQRFYRKRWNAFICTLSLKQAGHIRSMFEEMARAEPPLTLKPYQYSSAIKQIEENGSLVGVTSIESPDSPRSYSIHLAHLSEVGLWPSTTKVNAEAYAQAIVGAVPDSPGTVIVEESTAKGVGTYFHQHWLAAGAGESSFRQVFVPWFEIPKYQKPVKDLKAFARSLSPYETSLFRLGATLEGIRWYRHKLRDFRGDKQHMMSEFPSTPEEAFQSTGSRYFALDSVKAMRKRTRKARFQGTIEGAEARLPGALKSLRLKKDPHGPLRIWAYPPDLSDSSRPRYSNRYCAFADPGGKTEKADWSVVTVIDRLPMLEGNPVEVVARARVHLRPDLFALLAAQIAAYYNNALLAFEVNRYTRDSGDDVRGYEPEWSLAVIEEIADFYSNLFYRTQEDRHDQVVDWHIGFHMNRQTKPMILNIMDQALDEGLFVDPDPMSCDEMDTFEKKADGRLSAVSGNHDDIVISTAGCLWLALKHMSPVRKIIRYRPKPKPVSAATF